MLHGELKLKLVDMIMPEGYNFIAACDIANDIITELRTSNKEVNTWHVGRTTITVTLKIDNEKR